MKTFHINPKLKILTKIDGFRLSPYLKGIAYLFLPFYEVNFPSIRKFTSFKMFRKFISMLQSMCFYSKYAERRAKQDSRKTLPFFDETLHVYKIGGGG